MQSIRLIGMIVAMSISSFVQAQNLHYYFIDNVFQRSYFNPALDNKGNITIASGLGLDFNTNGPSISDVTTRKPEGGLIISASDAIAAMNDVNDIYGYSSVNTLDVSVNTPFVRISAGHAWKAQAWMQYTKDLAEFVTNGNAAFVGETMNLAPQLDYINYNEVYLGLQKSFGPLNVGVRIKRLSGVEAIRTENHKIDLTTSDDIYQLTVDSDFEIRSSRAFDYTDIENFNLDVEAFSFDNFMQNNGGWAFDFGASFNVGDRLELTLSAVDIGGLDWDVDPKIYRSNEVQTFDGIDVSEYISSDDEFVILDSIEALLDLVETNEAFNTSLPTKLFLGGKFKISDLWSVGALVQTNGSGDRRSSVIVFNGTARLYSFLSVGVLYSYRSSNLSNIGLNISLNAGPVTGFLSTDNIFRIGSFDSTFSNLRAGLSIRI
ncbi:MAG: DUF5723 family protein [Bacteroidota bacterium]